MAIRRIRSPRNAELLPHAIESRIASQILECRFHDIVAKRPILDGLIEPCKGFAVVTETGVGERNAVRTAVPATPLLEQRIANLPSDALIGCWDAKYFYWTLRPSHADPSITLTFALPNHPSYPSGHSCGSAAAATVLAYLFPDRAAELGGWVTKAGLSRMYAGIHYRFDIMAGQNLGKAVGQWAIGLDRQSGLLGAIH